MSIRLGKNIIAGYADNNNYNTLLNKPSINNITLTENRSLEDLGIQRTGDYIERKDLIADLKNVGGLSIPDYSKIHDVKLPFVADESGILICNVTLEVETIATFCVDGKEVNILNNFGLSISPCTFQILLRKGMEVTTKIDGTLRYYNYKFIPY